MVLKVIWIFQFDLKLFLDKAAPFHPIEIVRLILELITDEKHDIFTSNAFSNIEKLLKKLSLGVISAKIYCCP